ncbi:MAG: hypothetical protein AAFU85_25165, partial [Planctomycetota bacterium]
KLCLRHNFRKFAIKSVIKRGAYTHVLLRFKNAGDSYQVATFKDELPVQVADFTSTESGGEVVEKLRSVTRSEWASVGAEGHRLPAHIFGVDTYGGLSSELQATVQWRHGQDVDASLFKESTLGVVTPIPDSDFSTPLYFRE